jgi:hydroxyacylglutathione hydrolase
MRVFSAAAPPFMKNGFVIACDDSPDAVVVDPGDEVDDLLEYVRAYQLRVSDILLTHAHLDHISGVGRAKAALHAPVWLHREDLFLYDGILEQAEMFGLTATRQPAVDRYYNVSPSARPVAFGACRAAVRHTPGHCPGGVCLVVSEAGGSSPELFVGDTLFAGSIGRTDLPGGDYATLIESIQTVLMSFPDSTVVHAGHGPDTTIGEERRSNPFLVPSPPGRL